MSRENPNTPEQSSQSDLDWLAFRYIADELDASAREAFELRLAGDQTAREAVASTMEVTQKLYAAGEQSRLTYEQDLAAGNRRSPSSSSATHSPSTRSAARWTVRVSWIVAATVAFLLAGIAYWMSDTTAPIARSTTPAPEQSLSGKATDELADGSSDDSFLTDDATDDEETSALATVWAQSLDTSADLYRVDSGMKVEQGIDDGDPYTDVVYYPETHQEGWISAALEEIELEEIESEGLESTLSDEVAEPYDVEASGQTPEKTGNL